MLADEEKMGMSVYLQVICWHRTDLLHRMSGAAHRGGSVGSEGKSSSPSMELTDAAPEKSDLLAYRSPADTSSEEEFLSGANSQGPEDTCSGSEVGSVKPTSPRVTQRIADIASMLEDIQPLLRDSSTTEDSWGKLEELRDPRGLDETLGVDAPTDLEDKLDSAQETIRLVLFAIKYGDYAGRIWNWVRFASFRTSKAMPDKVVTAWKHLEEERRLGGGQTSRTLKECIRILKGDGLRVNQKMAELAIQLYARRNKLCHGKHERGDSVKDARDVDRHIPDEQREDGKHWERMVKLWDAAGEWLKDDLAQRAQQRDQRASDNSYSRFLANAPSSVSVHEQNEFRQAIDNRLRREELDLFIDGGARRPKTPYRTRMSARSDVAPYVDRKRKVSLSPVSSRTRGKRSSLE